MSFRTMLVFVGFCCACLVSEFALGADDTPVDLTEEMKESLVYLDVATY
jgi:hypothetical protein